MNATITYRLSSVGQKASILAGGNGAATQTLTVTPDHPDFARVIAESDINSDGVATLYAGSDYLDAIPTPAEILDRLEAVRAEAEANTEARRTAIRAATQTVLAERKTSYRKENMMGRVDFEIIFPDWPYASQCDLGPVGYGTVADIRESDEAKAWETEIAATNAADRARAEAELAELQAKEAAETAARRAKEAERRASLGLQDGDIDLDIEEGCLSEVPSGMWLTHKRGKNWFATIASDPKSPGGLARDFAVKAKGSLFYLLPNLSPGDAIEFGADYCSARGSKDANRWYGYVVRIADVNGNPLLILHQCNTGKAAIAAGKKHVATLVTV